MTRHPIALAAAAASALVLALTTASSPAVASHTLDGPLFCEATAQAGDPKVPAWRTAHEWGGVAPYCNGQWTVFSAPGISTPTARNRSEGNFANTKAEQRAQAGQTATFTAYIQPDVDKAGAPSSGSTGRHWTYVTQLIGPNYNGKFEGGPAVALSVRDGSWNIEGGRLDNGTHYILPVAPFKDDQTVLATVSVLLTERDDLPSITVKLKPIGELETTKTFTKRTFWHQYVWWSSGMYRGSGNGTPPSFTQKVSIRPVSFPPATYPTAPTTP